MSSKRDPTPVSISNDCLTNFVFIQTFSRTTSIKMLGTVILGVGIAVVLSYIGLVFPRVGTFFYSRWLPA